MTKYIDAEKLKAEIERRMNAYAGDSLSLGCTTAMDGFEPVLEIIDSLQQEQPEVDLEKEINELWKSLNTGHEYVVVDSYQDFLGICLHCFELGLNEKEENK